MRLRRWRVPLRGSFSRFAVKHAPLRVKARSLQRGEESHREQTSSLTTSEAIPRFAAAITDGGPSLHTDAMLYSCGHPAAPGGCRRVRDDDASPSPAHAVAGNGGNAYRSSHYWRERI